MHWWAGYFSAFLYLIAWTTPVEALSAGARFKEDWANHEFYHKPRVREHHDSRLRNVVLQGESKWQFIAQANVIAESQSVQSERLYTADNNDSALSSEQKQPSERSGSSGVFIKQNFAERNRAVVVFASDSNLAPGSELVATDGAGNQCSVKVVSVKDAIATVDTSTCKGRVELKAGQKLEASLFFDDVKQPHAVPRTESSDDSDRSAPRARDSNGQQFRFAVGLGFVSDSDLEFDDARVTTASGSAPIKATVGIKDSWVVSIEGGISPENSWGFIGGLRFAGHRKISDITFSGAGGTYTSLVDGDALGITWLYGNGVYRWNEFYIPLGINYSIPTFKPAPDSVGIFETGGGIGAQIGVGFLISQHVAFEFIIQSTAIDFQISSGDTTIDFGVGYLTDALFSGKVLF